MVFERSHRALASLELIEGPGVNHAAILPNWPPKFSEIDEVITHTSLIAENSSEEANHSNTTSRGFETERLREGMTRSKERAREREDTRLKRGTARGRHRDREIEGLRDKSGARGREKKKEKRGWPERERERERSLAMALRRLIGVRRAGDVNRLMYEVDRRLVGVKRACDRKMSCTKTQMIQRPAASTAVGGATVAGRRRRDGTRPATGRITHRRTDSPI
ncbi:hypothetical protein ACLOJK_019300 [Asimina triloba]